MWWNIHFFFRTNLVYSEETVRWSYLRIGQHDVLDEGQAPWLAIFHTYIVNLVATDLTVLLAWRQGAPHHFKRCGVQDLYLHPPWRSPRNCGWRNKNSNQKIRFQSTIFRHLWECGNVPHSTSVINIQYFITLKLLQILHTIYGSNAG